LTPAESCEQIAILIIGYRGYLLVSRKSVIEIDKESRPSSEGALARRVEPLPDLGPDRPQIADDGPGVVELVLRGDQQHGAVGAGEVGDGALLAQG